MVFSSLLFLYVFLPLNLLIYSLAKDIHTKNIIMLAFSLAFYAWGEPVYVLLLIGTVFANWYIALRLEACPEKKEKKKWLVVSCLVSLGVLGIFKYGTFTLLNLQAVFGFPKEVVQIALPIGISFYTFQILSYVIDVYRGEVAAQKSFAHLLMYTSLFHQCIAGPIVRYKDVSDEILNRKTNTADISRGVTRFAVGLGKKVLLANICGNIADNILLPASAASDVTQLAANIASLSAQPAMSLWLGVLAYMLQIYLDFSAYSDMAIGMGLMIGFHYKENFNYPYTASSVTGFWRRWHISLSTFFRDYVYIPLGGNRKGIIRTIANMFVVWMLTGLWHGASWNFVLWGLYYFVFLALEKLFFGKLLEKLPKPVGHVYLLLVVFFGWILFRFRQMPLASVVFRGLFCANGNAFSTFESGTVWLNYLLFVIIACFAVTPIAKNIAGNLKHRAFSNKKYTTFYTIARVAAPVAVLLLSTMALVGDSYNPFLYFQF